MYLVFKVETYIAFISQAEEYYAWKKPHESFYLKTFIIYILPHTAVFVFLIECDFSVFLVGGERKRQCVWMCGGVCVCMHVGGWLVLKYYKTFYSQLNLRLKIHWN